jgi:hypothetical protein
MKDFCCWVAGKDPDAKTIFASYADELGISANLHLQRTLSTPLYRKAFYLTRLPEWGDRGQGSERRGPPLVVSCA